MLELAPTACRRDEPLHSAVLPQPVPTAESTAVTRPLRVLFCTDNFGVGGTELNAVRTAEALLRRGVELEVAALQADGPLRARYDAAGVPIHAFPLANLYGPGAVRHGIRFAGLVRRGDFDVVHCHDIYTNIFAGFWARVGGARRVIVSRRWAADSTGGRLTALAKLAQRAGSLVLANSESIAELVNREGIAPRYVRVVHNFLDPEAFEAPPSEVVERWREAIGVPPGSQLLGIVARLSPVKNHSALFRAFAEIAPRFSRLHLAVIGDGPLRSELAALAEELGVAPRIHFVGLVPHSPNVNHCIELAILTSVSEGFPNTLAEAMAAGRAVIATAVGGVPDVVCDGDTGVLVPANDNRALVDALERLLDDPSMAQGMGSNGKSRAAANFSESKVLTGLMALYEELRS